MSRLRKALDIIPKNIEKHQFLINEGFKLVREGKSEYEFYGMKNDVQFRIFIWETSIRIIFSVGSKNEQHQDFNYTNETWNETYEKVLEYVSIFKIM